MVSWMQVVLFAIPVLRTHLCVAQFVRNQDAGGTPSAVKSVFRQEVADQLGRIHNELIRLHSSANQSQDNVTGFPGEIASVNQQVDKLLLYALPGFIGEAVDTMRETNGFISHQAPSQASDYGMSEAVRRASELAALRANPLTPRSLRSMDALEAINSVFSPALVDPVTETTYQGCQDAFQKGQRANGVYTIKKIRRAPFRVWCDFDHSGGWAVIQRRFDGSVEFCRSWDAYSNGFGSLWGEYWLGLRSIHQLANGGVQLSVYVEDFELGGFWYNYTYFNVLGANYNYRLSVGSVSGGVYDGLSASNGYMFSTWDKDNDGNSGNCAAATCSGWWFHSCSSGLPNGQYQRNAYWSFSPKVTIMRINA